MNALQQLPAKPEPHPIYDLVRKGKITIYQLSLRLNKSYSHTRNLISGFSEPTEETKQIFNQIIKDLEE